MRAVHLVVPEGVDIRSAACLALNYLVAWQMLRRSARVEAGETVLVRGAAGGVGSALLDLARALDLKAHGVASSEK